MNKYYPVEPVNIHLKSLINIILGKKLGNYHKKKGKDKLLIFCGYGERVIPIYGRHSLDDINYTPTYFINCCYYQTKLLLYSVASHMQFLKY